MNYRLLLVQKTTVPKSASVLFLCNHSSGDSASSRDDFKITEQLVEAGRIFDIRIIDRIIFGDHTFTASQVKSSFDKYIQ